MSSEPRTARRQRNAWALAGLALTLAIAAGMASISSCYDPPQPACGFRCGPDAACPSGYTCAADSRCHRDGTNVVCETFDAAVPDAPPDAALDAAPDAEIDAAIDAPEEAGAGD